MCYWYYLSVVFIAIFSSIFYTYLYSWVSNFLLSKKSCRMAQASMNLMIVLCRREASSRTALYVFLCFIYPMFFFPHYQWLVNIFFLLTFFEYRNSALSSLLPRWLNWLKSYLLAKEIVLSSVVLAQFWLSSVHQFQIH